MADRYNKATFADIPLHDYFRILEVKRSVLPSVTNFSKEIPGIDGEYFTGTKYGTRKITLSCAILSKDKEDYMDTVKNIAFILDTKTPSKLIIGDDEDIYYYAKISGETNLEKTKNMGTFEIEFVCFDPYGYSVEEDVFEADEDKVVSIENSGTTNANPTVSVVFHNDAHFLQCTNYDTKTILVGQPPRTTSTKATNKIALNEPCETLSNWDSIGNVIDAGRNVNGNLVVNSGGWGIALGDAGSNESGWHGGGLRRNIGKNIKDFKIEVKMSHNSKGDVAGTGGGTSGTVSSNGTKYTVTASPSLRIRSGRGTSYKILGNVPKGKTVSVSDISKKWGKVTYSGVTGYIYMEYVKKQTTSSSSSSGGSGGTTTSKTVKYKVTSKTGLIIRSGRGTKYKKVITMPYNTVVSIDSSTISKNWGKVTYNGKTGYCSMQYLSKVKTSSKSRTVARSLDEENPSTENKIGVCEVYGFDQNGTKLFKFELIDDQKWFEYTEPKIEFGSTLMVDDNKKCPSPKTTTKTEDGKKVTYKVDSGKYGDWNEFTGWFTLERVTEKNQQKWYAKVEKIDKDGKVTKKLESKKVTGNYPKGDLNNIVIFIGGYKSEELVDYMNVHHVRVTDLSKEEDEVVLPIFGQGDELLIDNAKQKIYKNGQLFMSELDIGSQFFSSPVGSSEFICKSDDNSIDVVSSIRKKWL